MDEFPLILSLVAILVSLIVARDATRIRSSDSFATLYDQFNTDSFGYSMEAIGNWIDGVATERNKRRRDLEPKDTRDAYRDHLALLRGENTKNDELERARRTVKAWYIKCLLFYEAHDISRAHLRALITPSRWALMLRVIDMTREQDKFWKGSSYNGQCSDDPYFTRLERLVGTRSTS